MDKLKTKDLEKQVKNCYDAWIEWTRPGNMDLLPPCDMLDTLARIFEHYGHDILKHANEQEKNDENDTAETDEIVRQLELHTPNHPYQG